MKKTNYVLRGFTLVEMMVSMAVASISMAGIISVFANTVQNNTESIKYTRLNQELRAIMDVMSNDIRRAGYWADANGITANPFATSTAALAVTGNSCITYSYDVDDSGGPITSSDNQGVKLIGNSVGIMANANGCGDSAAGDWDIISDPNSIEITNLNFQIISDADAAFASCINLTSQARDCNTAISGDQIRSINVVTITLAGRLINDISVNDSLAKTITVRNPVTSVVP